MKTQSKTIDVKYLKTFYQVVKHKNLTAAADALFMTQPAVSQHIKKIETIIGTEVFDRQDRFGLTRQGKILLSYADQSMNLYEKLFEDLERASTKEKVSIAISDSFSQKIIDQILNELRMLDKMETSVCFFCSSSFPERIEEFDLIFSFNHLVNNTGKSYNISSSHYVMAQSLNSEHVPEVIVYCQTLRKSHVQTILIQNNIDISKVKNWVTTSCSTLIKSQLQLDNTLVICPDWCIKGIDCYVSPTKQLLNMYVWCSDTLTKEFDTKGIKRRIHQVLGDNGLFQ